MHTVDQNLEPDEFYKALFVGRSRSKKKPLRFKVSCNYCGKNRYQTDLIDGLCEQCAKKPKRYCLECGADITFDYLKVTLCYKCRSSRVVPNHHQLYRLAILERDNYTCRYCGKKVLGRDAHIDHMMPKSRSGNDTPDNLVTACTSCNCSKGTRTYEEYMEYLGRQQGGI